MSKKNLNALVPEELHKKLKMQLLRDNMTYKDWLFSRLGIIQRENKSKNLFTFNLSFVKFWRGLMD